jgi:hypothetical protein
MIDTSPKFDEDYFKEYFRRQHALKNQTPGASKALPVEGCEYSRIRDDLTMLRDCTLSRMQCGEQGWRHNFKQCDLRKHALSEKQE